MNDKKEIRYLNRDFQTTLKKLVDYTKYYYPDSFNDFSPASPAMIILQLISYVGDVLNFYIDRQTKQSILYYATKKQSIYNIAQAYGYRIKTGIPSAVPLSFEFLVPLLQNGSPDYRYAPVILPGTVVYSSQIPNSTFTVLNTINFKEITYNDQILPIKVEDNTHVILRKKVYGYSVIQKTLQVKLQDIVKQNIKIYLPDKNVVKVTSVKDSNNSDWYQVLNLANDTVIDQDIQYKNYIRAFKRKKSNKRFKKVVDSNDNTFLYFGAKQRTSNLSSQLYQAFYKFDSNQLATPSMLLLNNNYGQVPFNTTLTIKYLISNNSSVSSNTVNQISSFTQYNNQYPSLQLYNQLLTSLSVTNTQPSSGGSGIQSLQSIKQNALATINSQHRLVTKQDYQLAVRLMPAQYGSIAKSFVKKNNTTNKIQLYVLSYDNEKRLCNTVNQIKTNLGQFISKNRMLGDFISIKDAYIINVGCQFTIVTQNGYSKRQLLYKSMNVIKQFMSVDNYQIGSYIDVNQLRNKILSIQGVINVINLKFINKKGGEYSLVDYDMPNSFYDGKYFTSHSPSIFQLKYPEIDIVGSVV